MRYILDQDEMDAIATERKALRDLPGGANHLEALKNVCQNVATTLLRPGAKGPYGCIHVDRANSFGYCDLCPVAGICPQPKEWSK